MTGASTSMSDLFDIRAAEQTLWQEDQGDCQNGKGSYVLVVDRKIGRPHGLDETDQDAADYRAGKRSYAAQYGGGERLHARNETVGEAHDAVVHQVHGAGDGGERGRYHERHRDGAVNVDTDKGRHLLILLAGALRAAETGLRHQIPETGKQQRGDDPNNQLLMREGDRVAVFRE